MIVLSQLLYAILNSLFGNPWLLQPQQLVDGAPTFITGKLISAGWVIWDWKNFTTGT